ncbi:MAG: hypothetical protein L0G36_04525, partial [Brevibacterium sp.]|nr:hypothetical protein [Brevibacterium sp.]
MLVACRVSAFERGNDRSAHASTPSAATTVAPVAQVAPVAPAAMLSAVCAWATVVMTAMRLGPASIEDALVPPVVCAPSIALVPLVTWLPVPPGAPVAARAESTGE